MRVGIGMRATDLRQFLIVARDAGVILLVRHTNEDSFQYVGLPGYYPKPAMVKAKTADRNPPPSTGLASGRKTTTQYAVAGLVVHPGFHANCFGEKKQAKAEQSWKDTLKVIAPSLVDTTVDPQRSATWSVWGVERTPAEATHWKWRVDINANSRHFGCLQLLTASGWCYVHGDYDLKDVIVPGRETENVRTEGRLDGVKNYTPLLYQREFERIVSALNTRMGVDMVQHGAEAQYAWHGDEPITVAFPDWRHLLLYDAVTVQLWYEKLNREVLAPKGHDYVRNRSNMYVFGPAGAFRPGNQPATTWGK